MDSSNLESPKEEAKKILKINIKQAHEYLGHLSEDTTRKTALQLGMNLLRGTLPVCESFAIAKARQRNVPKEISGENKTTGDTSTILPQSKCQKRWKETQSASRIGTFS